jgi:hypothetical protein
MQNKLDVTFEGDYVQAISDGEKDFAFVTRLWSEVAKLCEKHNCFNVLGIANTTAPIEAFEAYDHARLFDDLNIAHPYRIAWVELNLDAVDMAAFVEMVLSNRGLPGRLFANVSEATEWLLGDDRENASP